MCKITALDVGMCLPKYFVIIINQLTLVSVLSVQLFNNGNKNSIKTECDFLQLLGAIIVGTSIFGVFAARSMLGSYAINLRLN